jgi:chromosome segregation ATPase
MDNTEIKNIYTKLEKNTERISNLEKEVPTLLLKTETTEATAKEIKDDVKEIRTALQQISITMTANNTKSISLHERHWLAIAGIATLGVMVLNKYLDKV